MRTSQTIMLSAMPVVRSGAARMLFLASMVVTSGLLLWDRYYVASHGDQYLTQIFYWLFVIHDSHAAWCLLLITLAAAFVPSRFPARALLLWIGEHPLRIAAGTAAVLCAGCLLVYRNHPLSMDEYAQFLQSQVFATGHLSGHFPPALLDWLIPKVFQNAFLSVSPAGAVASSYWPSFALLLTPFTFCGIPWACNAVISALTLLAVHRLALRMFGDLETAGLAVLLTAASPVIFANGISYYSMPAHLLANSVYALLLLQPTNRRAFLAGLVGSVALTLHNPVPHILFAAPWLLAIARRPDGSRLVGALVAGYLPLSVALGVGWFWLTGELRHPAMSATAPAGGLSVMWGSLDVFTLPDWGIVLARMIGLAKIWLWAVPGLLLLAAAGAWKWRRHAPCRLLLASALLTLAGYLLVPVDQGHGWGYRYFHSAWVALPLLAAGALTRTPASAGDMRAPETDAARNFVVACALLTLVFGIGFRAVQMHAFIMEDMRQVPAYAGTERRVMIIDTRTLFYGQDLVQNDPWLRGNLTRMTTHGAAADAQMMRTHFPRLHLVYADRYGSVWSEATPRAPVARP